MSCQISLLGNGDIVSSFSCFLYYLARVSCCFFSFRQRKGVVMVVVEEDYLTATQPLTAAQINNPPVAMMKMNTTASSFLESLSVSHVSGTYHTHTRHHLFFFFFLPFHVQKRKNRNRNKNSRKQVVNTSSSLAPLQMGRLYERQNCRLQVLQLPPVCVFFLLPSSSSSSLALSWSGEASGSGLLLRKKSVSKTDDDGTLDAGGGWPPSGIMVLFVKHVHLQNEVGADC